VENFNEMQVKYEVAQKEKDTIIAQQKSKLQLTWFISIVFLITLIAIGLFFYMRNRNKIKTLEESIKIRNTISANLHDDVGSALSSISIISDMVKSVVTKNPEKANELIDKISETSNEVMSNMKDIVWSINPNNDHVENLLAKMREFAANVLENGKIEMIYNDQTAGKAKIDVVNRPEVYLIFKEAINNVAKYAKASLVEINLYNTAEHFCIEIFDNGIGFDKDKVEMGNGLINMHKRAEKIGAKFTLQSEINIGTKINLIV
jgi:signal transduction histidine kinase